PSRRPAARRGQDRAVAHRLPLREVAGGQVMRRLVPLVALPAALTLAALVHSPPPGTAADDKERSRPQAHGLSAPPSYKRYQLADDKLVPDAYCMTLGPDGQIIVSGRGYIRQLVFGEGSRKGGATLDFAGAPKDGAMGLCWDGKDLYCVGDGGLRVYRDAGGKGRTRPPELLFACRTGGEHLAHAVKRGPDGWMYLLVGDQTRITRKHITSPTSPIQDPVGGCVLRFSPDFKRCEVVADGLRNAYAMDFDEA